MLINNYYTICPNLGNLLNNTRKVALITLCLKKAPFDHYTDSLYHILTFIFC